MAVEEKIAKTKGETPLMRQYWKIKDRHPNAILLFRMGDFYETFDDDARLVSRVLGITLTKRSNGQAKDIALAGFPHHAIDSYLPKLIQAGHRVAVCEQLEDPKFARKIVKRDVVEVVTPGVSFHDRLIDPRRSNYLAAVCWSSDRENSGWAGFAFLDATTGEFFVTEIPEEQLPSLLQTVSPAELLYDKRHRDHVNELRDRHFVITPQEDWCFGYDFAYETLIRHFKTHSLKGYGIESLRLGIIAAGATLYYLGETQKGKLPHIRRITHYPNDEFISLDPQTRRNLELVASIHDGSREGSLVQCLDQTQTPMGARLLRKWLVRPLRNVAQIERRLDAVEALAKEVRIRDGLREELRQVGDIERLVGRVCTGRATPRDLAHLRLTLRQIPPIKALLDENVDKPLRKIGEELLLCHEVVDRIEATLVDEPPASLNDGGLIRPGFSKELDDLREVASSGKDWVARMQAEESKRTGIPSLKVGYNRVFGYYIEITNAHKGKVPDDFIRKQTLVNAERYITPALKEYEEKILTAEEKIGQLESALFQELRMAVAERADDMLKNAGLLATLDCFATLSEVAERNRYTRPQIHEGNTLEIKGGRHPVVEQMLPPGEPFIPNDVALDPDQEQILIITGPNMAGKSVVLRQTGLIVLLAQVGSFVPAESASVGIVDKIFTRVGASDNLAAGESTFLVEMNETANILNNATQQSLILLDEVGRGTSTFDGLSIAWSIVEYLHENPQVAARTLFATHYHELNALADRYPRVRNARIQVQEHDGRVIFLRKMVPGGADHSYGIEVARMAGLPEAVITRAREVLEHLESQELVVDRPTVDSSDNRPSREKKSGATDQLPSFQMSLFSGNPVAEEVLEKVRRLDYNRLTPIEALMQLADLKRLADGDEKR